MSAYTACAAYLDERQNLAGKAWRSVRSTSLPPIKQPTTRSRRGRKMSGKVLRGQQVHPMYGKQMEKTHTRRAKSRSKILVKHPSERGLKRSIRAHMGHRAKLRGNTSNNRTESHGINLRNKHNCTNSNPRSFNAQCTSSVKNVNKRKVKKREPRPQFPDQKWTRCISRLMGCDEYGIVMIIHEYSQIQPWDNGGSFFCDLFNSILSKAGNVAKRHAPPGRFMMDNLFSPPLRVPVPRYSLRCCRIFNEESSEDPRALGADTSMVVEEPITLLNEEKTQSILIKRIFQDADPNVPEVRVVKRLLNQVFSDPCTKRLHIQLTGVYNSGELHYIFERHPLVIATLPPPGAICELESDSNEHANANAMESSCVHGHDDACVSRCRSELAGHNGNVPQGPDGLSFALILTETTEPGHASVQHTLTHTKMSASVLPLASNFSVVHLTAYR